MDPEYNFSSSEFKKTENADHSVPSDIENGAVSFADKSYLVNNKPLEPDEIEDLMSSFEKYDHPSAERKVNPPTARQRVPVEKNPAIKPPKKVKDRDADGEKPEKIRREKRDKKIKVREVPQDETVNKTRSGKKIALITSVSIVALFFLVIGGLFIAGLILPDREISPSENRSLAQFPKFSITALFSGDYAKDLEAYLSDQVAGRDAIVSAKTKGERISGKTEINDVYIGKDGWLFEKPSVYDPAKTDVTVEKIVQFASSHDFANKLFVLVPNSTFILPDKLPQDLVLPSQSEYIGKIRSAVGTQFIFTDAVGLLNGVEDKESLYYKNDHHWTTRGAAAVFEGIRKAWFADLPAVTYDYFTVSESFGGTLSNSVGYVEIPDKIEICVPELSVGSYVVQNVTEKTRKTTLFEKDKLAEQNQYEVFLGGNFAQINISTTVDTTDSLLLFKDSYANCLIPMLTPYFNKITVIDPRFFNDDIERVINDGNYSHLMFLYNVNTFLADTSLKDVL